MGSRVMWLSLVTGAVLALGTASAAASGLPKVPTAPSANPQFRAKPAIIQIAGDGSFYFAGRKESNGHAGPLQWSRWTAGSGDGSGFNWVDNCHPDCASGTFHQYPVKLHVWRPEDVGGHHIFTRMTVTYTSGRPSSIPNNPEVFKVHHKKNGFFFWSYPNK